MNRTEEGTKKLFDGNADGNARVDGGGNSLLVMARGTQVPFRLHAIQEAFSTRNPASIQPCFPSG